MSESFFGLSMKSSHSTDSLSIIENKCAIACLRFVDLFRSCSKMKHKNNNAQLLEWK